MPRRILAAGVISALLLTAPPAAAQSLETQSQETVAGPEAQGAVAPGQSSAPEKAGPQQVAASVEPDSVNASDDATTAPEDAAGPADAPTAGPGSDAGPEPSESVGSETGSEAVEGTGSDDGTSSEGGEPGESSTGDAEESTGSVPGGSTEDEGNADESDAAQDVASDSPVADETDPAADSDQSEDAAQEDDAAQEEDESEQEQGDTAEPVQSVEVRAAGALTPEATSAVVRRYVASILRQVSVGPDGLPQSCFCAVAVALSLDGPSSATAKAGLVSAPGSSVSADSIEITPAATASSGRSGDTVAVSLTGRGAANASAVSGSTGRVLPWHLGAAGGPAAAGPAQRSTTVDLERLSTAVQVLATDIGSLSEAATGAQVDEHVSLLLANLPADPGGRSADVDIATWSGGSSASVGGSDVRCSPVDDGSNVPSCAIAVSVSVDGVAKSSVQYPIGRQQLSGSGTTSTSPRGPPWASPGVPGMATAVAVSLDGAARADARNGDQGGFLGSVSTRDVTPAPTLGSGSTASSRSGDSGAAIAVAMTISGVADTDATSGLTGSATSMVAGPGGTSRSQDDGTSGSVDGATPGRGGEASADALSGDSGTSLSWITARDGAAGLSSSGDTGDASAQATDGEAGRDWSPDGTTTAGRVEGGTGGQAEARAATGETGSSLSIVISDRSAAAESSSGPTGHAAAGASGGRGGSTHLGDGPGDGDARSGDGGKGSVQSQTGNSGDAVAVHITRADATVTSGSGSSGTASSTSRGGNSGCASSGIDPAEACADPAPDAELPDEEPAPAPGGSATSGGGTISTGPVVRVQAHSADSADLTCTATAGTRQCTTASTPEVLVQAPAPPAPSREDQPDVEDLAVAAPTEALDEEALDEEALDEEALDEEALDVIVLANRAEAVGTDTSDTTTPNDDEPGPVAVQPTSADRGLPSVLAMNLGTLLIAVLVVAGLAIVSLRQHSARRARRTPLTRPSTPGSNL